MDRGQLKPLEELFGRLQVKYGTPLELSQQYVAQQNLPDDDFYLPIGWRVKQISGKCGDTDLSTVPF